MENCDEYKMVFALIQCIRRRGERFRFLSLGIQTLHAFYLFGVLTQMDCNKFFHFFVLFFFCVIEWDTGCQTGQAFYAVQWEWNTVDRQIFMPV